MPAFLTPLAPDVASAATGPSALPAPFHPLVASIRTHAAARETASAQPSGTELLLHPADLGRIRFALSGSGTQLSITVAADNPGTLQLLQSHAADLRAELAREGFGQASLTFSGQGTGDTGGQGARDHTGAALAIGDTPDLAPQPLLPTPTPRAPQPGGGLDLRF
jgi:hypothetical protein